MYCGQEKVATKRTEIRVSQDLYEYETVGSSNYLSLSMVVLNSRN